MSTLMLTDSTTHDVAHDFKTGRAIIMFDGAYVMVDLVGAPTGTPIWELSGEPARPGPESRMLTELVRVIEAQGTVVTVTEPE